eukprot:TRINITY_DN8659_c0_g1_i1.p1 TRINITY_DN8659_c0_g1~~TRINITY_DN8659_c0_g1_i1.p1  ORF type:complete len:685 (-),score=154.97 TRINITY_DN8659_c0_g1_i1:46-2070(-)
MDSLPQQLEQLRNNLQTSLNMFSFLPNIPHTDKALESVDKALELSEELVEILNLLSTMIKAKTTLRTSAKLLLPVELKKNSTEEISTHPLRLSLQPPKTDIPNHQTDTKSYFNGLDVVTYVPCSNEIEEEEQNTEDKRKGLTELVEQERERQLKEDNPTEIPHKIQKGELETVIMKVSKQQPTEEQSISIRVPKVEELPKEIKPADIGELLVQFKNADNLKTMMNSFNLLKQACGITDNDIGLTIYQKLENKTAMAAHWCRQMWKNLEVKMSHPDYKIVEKGKNPNVLVIGAGPGGLTTAIECAMMGSSVLVLEKRDYMIRNNILHLWPFTMDYLKRINAKTFYSKFGTGGIDHIGTKQIQRLLLKIALLLGVKVVYGTQYEGVEYDTENSKWSVKCSPSIDFSPSVIVGADGEKSTVVKEFDFQRKEYSGSLSIGITVNYVNNHTKDEVTLREFGISSHFQQSFFKELNVKYGIELENLVYYRGETHYFVMTAKKKSLINRSVFKTVTDNNLELLKPSNLDLPKLLEYTRDVATFCGIPATCKVVMDEHRKQEDIALFDFTKRLMCDEAVKYVPAPGSTEPNSGLVVGLVGDALMQPFWPLGTGCNRAVLSAMDTAWMVHDMAKGTDVEKAVSDRNNVYLKMRSTLSGGLVEPYSKCSVDPGTRYSTKSCMGF